jgi:hypothetical protein
VAKKLQKLDLESGKLCPSGVFNVTLKKQQNSVAFTFIHYQNKHGTGKFTLEQARKPRGGVEL